MKTGSNARDAANYCLSGADVLEPVNGVIRAAVTSFGTRYVRELGPYCVHYRHAQDFDRIWSELFDDHAYRFTSQTDAPFIIDAGSHIGLTILHFKLRFPKARILGFEPDPVNLSLLRFNIAKNRLQDVRIVEKAIWSRTGEATIYRETIGENPSTWGNSIIYNMWGDANDTTPVAIQTVRLGQYINQPVDFLKLDIEGSEEQVLNEVEPKLGLVRAIELEYHGSSTAQSLNDLHRITTLLSRNGFSVDVRLKDASLICRPQTVRRVNPEFAQIRAVKSVSPIWR